jgi:hypothetical protein
MRCGRITLAIIFGAGIVFTASPPARADFTFEAVLSGANQAPPVASTATGKAVVTFVSSTDTLDYSVTFSGLASPSTGAHIHFGASGTNGPVIFEFMNPSLTSATSGSYRGVLTAADLLASAPNDINTFADALSAIEAGDTYVNIHDAVFASGEIRGQLQAVPEPTSLLLTGLGLVALCGYTVRARRRPSAG